MNLDPPGERRDFARALLASGILEAHRRARTGTRRSGDPFTTLREILSDRDPFVPVSWQDPTLPGSADPPAVSTHDLAAQWRTLRTSSLTRLALRGLFENSDPMWIIRTLLDAGTSLSPFLVLDRQTSERQTSRPEWRFPLRVGFLDTPVERRRRERLIENLQGSSWRSTLIAPVLIGRNRVACDLLLLDQPAQDAAFAVQHLREARAGAVFITRGLERWDATLVSRLTAATSAWAVGFAPVDDLETWLSELIVRLSHDYTLDMAFTETLGRSGVLAADATVISQERVSLRARSVAGALRRAAYEPGVAYFDAPEVPLADEFDQIAQQGQFIAGGGDASELARLERIAAPIIDYAQARRHLQARISVDGVNVQGLTANREHRIDVRIGAAASGWLDHPAPFPHHELPPTAGEHRLTVVLTEPHLLPKPLVQEVVLPPSGNSTAASFIITTTTTTTSIDARIIVLHRNRVLQTARLPHAVLPPSPVPHRRLLDVAELETFVSPAAGSLEARRTFDVAFVVNKNSDGESRVTHVNEGGAGIVKLSAGTIIEAVEKISGLLGKIVKAPEDFDGLEQTESVGLLAALAYWGRMMRDGLVADSEGLADVLDQFQYVQVVSAKPDAYFPFELAYDFPAPKPGAALCPSALLALAMDDPEATCPATHTGDVVCPFGFWGLTRVIERHAFHSSLNVAGDFMVRGGPSYDGNTIPLGGAVLAASKHVDEFLKGSIATVATALATVTGTKHVVEQWEEWVDAVRTERPALLMLLPHTIYNDAYETYGLEIGANAQRLAGEIDSTFVPPPDARPVIVVLLGCETARAGAISYEQFPSRLRLAGAKIVIATLTEVLGRHAAPVAVKLVSELHSPACAERAMGDVMLQLRRKLLRDGLLAVLAVVAFGDADWSITRAA